jgi:hypothetical protein
MSLKGNLLDGGQEGDLYCNILSIIFKKKAWEIHEKAESQYLIG